MNILVVCRPLVFHGGVERATAGFLGALVVYGLVWPMLTRFSLGMQQLGGEGQATIELLPKVDDYLSLVGELG